MNRQFLVYFSILFISVQLNNCDSYLFVESEKTWDNLLNNLLELKQLDNNPVNEESTYSAKVSEASDRSKSPLKQNQNSAKKTNQKQKSCHSCNTETIMQSYAEDHYRQRLEYIKQQILSKLGMDKAPKVDTKNIDVSAYMNLLEASQSIDPSPEEFIQKSLPQRLDKLFIFPKARKFNKPAFNLSIDSKNCPFSMRNCQQSIKKITLFVKQNTVTSYYDKEIAVVSAIVPINRNLTPYEDISNVRVLGIVNPQSANDKYGSIGKQSFQNWLQYNVTDLLKPEITKRHKLISFDSEGLDMNNSFITIELYHQNNHRIKRSIDCNGNSSSCCRENFYVNFTTIGWDNWILQPAGYNANYCKGKCDISHARYHHTTVIGKYPAINLCCSPRNMSDISLIYVDDNGFVFQKNLPNMVVESCDCA